MGVTLKVRWQLLVVLAFILNVFIVVGETEDSYSEDFDGDEDTVVIKAQDKVPRNSRHVILRSPSLQAYHPFLLNQAQGKNNNYDTTLIASRPCFSSRGQLGKCMPFRQCYPYFKLPELNNWDTWVLGMYDTCSYFTAQGRQMFGVCCTGVAPKPEDGTTEAPQVEGAEPEGTTKPEESKDNPKIPQYPLANWPPPLPTHPPDHTIPPLPTHPPSPGYPTQATPMYPTNPPPGHAPEYPPPGHPLPPGYPSQPGHPPPGYPIHVYPPTVATKPTTKKPISLWPTQPPYKPKPTKPPIASPPVSDAKCGAKNGYQEQERIVGGHNADLGEWPWIAALFNGGRQFCGGSLIDDSHILSAAHCVAHMSSWDVARLTVRLADYNIKTNSEVKHIEKKVKRVVRHRGFDARTLYNDIAILTLDTPVQFNQQVRSICLPSASDTFAGKTATVIGWGSLREMGPQPSVLQEVNIPIWRNEDCRQKYGNAAPGGIVEHMLCAGQASRDSCSGDSGGPLMVNKGKWVQVGIVSWGIGCGKGQYPGVYTRVETFLPWIYKNLK